MNARPVLWAGCPEAAQAVRQLCPQAAADALARAGEICGHTFLFRDHWEMEPTREPVHFDGPVVWDAVPAGDPEWTYALNRHTIFVHLGRAWQYTGQARYLDAFVSLLEDWLDRVPRTPASENTTWRALEAGLRPENWLRALGRLEENLRHAVLPDGVQWEQSPMYHCEVLHALLDTLLLAERNGIAVPPLLSEKARAMCRALAVWAAPDRTILPQGDSDVIDAGDLLAAGALLFRDPLLAAAAQGPLCEETLWDFGPDAPARLAALPAAWPDCPSQKLEASGNYILRSGWGREDTWIHFRAGSLGGGHGHADLLHVDVYHGGEAVLTDAGRGTYVDGGLRRALKGPAAHNTFRVDGAGFTCYRGTWEWGPIAQPLPALARFTPLADRLAGGHLGYLAQGAAVERQLVFLKPGLLVGADILRAPDGRPHRAEQFFHFGPGRLTAGESAALWEGGHTCAQLHWLSGQRAECFAAPCAPAYNRVEDAPALRLDAPAAAGVTALVWVLSLGGPCQAELVPVSTGAGQPRPVRPRLPGRRPMGPGPEKRRDAGDDPDLQAPRRLLTLAQRPHRLQREICPLERGLRRRGEGGGGGLPPGRAEVRGLPFPLGPARPPLRRRQALRRLLRGPAHRAADRLRGAVLRLAGRRLRRRPERQAPGLRLGPLL